MQLWYLFGGSKGSKTKTKTKTSVFVARKTYFIDCKSGFSFTTLRKSNGRSL